MIPQAHITAWRRAAPWSDDAQVEQDLVLSRAAVELFSDPALAGKIALRGGTSLNKLYIHPPRRYSEDIDLVQTEPSPIGPILDAIRGRLDGWLGWPRRSRARGGIHHVRGRVRQPFLNGKIERAFRSFRGWWRFVPPTLTISGLQTKLDNFKGWYNEHRVHAALGAMTPNEAATQPEAPAPIPIRQRDHRNASIKITRRPCRGDPRLPIIDIAVQLRRAA